MAIPPVPVLTPAQIDGLARLLSSALDIDALQRIVYLATGDQLFVAYVAPGKPLRPTIFDLLLEFEKLGITRQFLKVVYQERPFRADLRAAILAIYPDIAPAAEQTPANFVVQHSGVAEASEPGVGPGLQRNIRPRLKQLDLRRWLDRIEAVERQICRIEAGSGAIGTGFLVGPSAVLTNWHVVEEARVAGTLGQLACRFDYRRLSNNTLDAGKLIAVRKIVDESRSSPAELTANPDQPPPEPDELDYALLELETPVGAERGFVVMVGAPVAAGDALIIVQHPSGEPATFTVDTNAVEGYIHSGRRLRYKTNTEPGSSGSPCFSMDFDLVALHHLGDPRKQATYNQGIPITLVRDSIVARGHAALLAA